MQWHYEFQDWEEAFKQFYRKHCGEQLLDDDGRVLGFRAGDENLVFVVSTAPYVSGYWIEPADGAEANKHTMVYRTVEQVRQLEQRVRRARDKTVSLSVGGLVV